MADDLVTRSQEPVRSKHVTYALTPEGRSLETVIAELIRWGARYMDTGPEDDTVDPAWTVLALRALLDGPTESNEPATMHVTVGGSLLTITNDRGLRRVRTGHRGVASARLEASMPSLVAVSSGMRPVSDLADMVEGERAVIQAVLSPTPRPRPTTDEPSAADAD